MKTNVLFVVFVCSFFASCGHSGPSVSNGHFVNNGAAIKLPTSRQNPIIVEGTTMYLDDSGALIVNHKGEATLHIDNCVTIIDGHEFRGEVWIDGSEVECDGTAYTQNITSDGKTVYVQKWISNRWLLVGMLLLCLLFLVRQLFKPILDYVDEVEGGVRGRRFGLSDYSSPKQQHY